MENYSFLEWDSNFFQKKIAKITDINNLLNEEVNEILEILKSKKYNLVYFFSKKERNSFDKILKKYNGKILDKKVTYLKTMSKRDILSSEIVKYKLNYPTNDLIKLAIDAGIYSRFNIDENIKKYKFEELYKNWIINSVNKSIAKDVLVYNYKNKIIAMVTLGEKNNIADIGIIAVNENFRGKGIGKKLILSAENWAIENNFKKLQVVTQKDNINACKFYENSGYKISKTEYIYHFWL
ncbi:MAG: hypothetical protein B6I24_10435 [Bacteroidetes bacterium 4572_128]|nr:MAG: hypothetical protein B6I24_10435 [Bacteroidetes bacterium 4572_128]